MIYKQKKTMHWLDSFAKAWDSLLLKTFGPSEIARAGGQNGILSTLRMDITGMLALFDNRPRCKNIALLLDITVVNPCASSDLENAPRHAAKHFANAIKIFFLFKFRDSFPATYSLIPLDTSKYVTWLAQTCMPSSRSSPSDG